MNLSKFHLHIYILQEHFSAPLSDNLMLSFLGLDDDDDYDGGKELIAIFSSPIRHRVESLSSLGKARSWRVTEIIIIITIAEIPVALAQQLDQHFSFILGNRTASLFADGWVIGWLYSVGAL